MNEIKLKPCPFCGGEAVLCPTSTGSGHIACIGDCDMATKKYWDERIDNTGSRKWYEVAAETWNKRTEMPNTSHLVPAGNERLRG